jgi:hypothetical protein
MKVRGKFCISENIELLGIIIVMFEQVNDKDVISHALTMLLNILHVFIRLIKVMIKVVAKIQAAKKKTR